MTIEQEIRKEFENNMDQEILEIFIENFIVKNKTIKLPKLEMILEKLEPYFNDQEDRTYLLHLINFVNVHYMNNN